MIRRTNLTGQWLGDKTSQQLPSSNHFNLPDKILKVAAAKGYRRVAGNVFILPTDTNFWAIQPDGRIQRITGTEVDSGSHPSAAAPANDPQGFMADILSDLTL